MVFRCAMLMFLDVVGGQASAYLVSSQKCIGFASNGAQNRVHWPACKPAASNSKPPHPALQDPASGEGANGAHRRCSADLATCSSTRSRLIHFNDAASTEPSQIFCSEHVHACRVPRQRPFNCASLAMGTTGPWNRRCCAGP